VRRSKPLLSRRKFLTGFQDKGQIRCLISDSNDILEGSESKRSKRNFFLLSHVFAFDTSQNENDLLLKRKKLSERFKKNKKKKKIKKNYWCILRYRI
jgi:hypothetical protein